MTNKQRKQLIRLEWLYRSEADLVETLFNGKVRVGFSPDSCGGVIFDINLDGTYAKAI